jgi:ABC-2 type transport system permease protein
MTTVDNADTYAVPRSRSRLSLAPLRGTAFVYKWELLKLRAQKRTYLGLGAAAIVPIAFVLALIFRSGGPGDITLGKYLRQSGLATPFVVLEFMAIWGLPLITALVAGDIVASESHNGTLKTILTRSRERGEIFAGKVLATATYTLAAVVVMAGIGLAAATAEWGFKPLTSLSGPKVSALHSLVLLLGTLGVYLLALLGIAAFGLLISTITRNSAAAVVSTLMFALMMQLVGALPGTQSIRPYLLSNQFTAWHGFLRVPIDWAPIGHAIWLSAIYLAVPLVAAYLVFLRRDVAGD